MNFCIRGEDSPSIQLVPGAGGAGSCHPRISGPVIRGAGM